MIDDIRTANAIKMVSTTTFNRACSSARIFSRGRYACASGALLSVYPSKRTHRRKEGSEGRKERRTDGRKMEGLRPGGGKKEGKRGEGKDGRQRKVKEGRAYAGVVSATSTHKPFSSVQLRKAGRAGK